MGRGLAAVVAAAICGLVSGGAAGADTATHQFANLAPIALRSGVNAVSDFAPDGRPAQIVLGWRDNGNAHGYDVLLILMRPAASEPWNVVAVETERGEPPADLVADDPHMGDDVVKAVRLVKGTMDKRPATLLLTATRQWKETIPEPALVTFRVYRLTENKAGAGMTRDYFALVQTTTSATKFCNAEIALAKNFGLPPRSGSAPTNSADGC